MPSFLTVFPLLFCQSVRKWGIHLHSHLHDPAALASLLWQTVPFTWCIFLPSSASRWAMELMQSAVSLGPHVGLAFLLASRLLSSARSAELEDLLGRHTVTGRWRTWKEWASSSRIPNIYQSVRKPGHQKSFMPIPPCRSSYCMVQVSDWRTSLSWGAALMFLVYRFACDQFSFSLPKNVSFIPLLKTLSQDLDFCGSLFCSSTLKPFSCPRAPTVSDRLRKIFF